MKPIRYLLTCILLFVSELVSAQCSMCRAVLESGADTKMAEQLNDGIVYLMMMPYLLVGTIRFIVSCEILIFLLLKNLVASDNSVILFSI